MREIHSQRRERERDMEREREIHTYRDKEPERETDREGENKQILVDERENRHNVQSAVQFHEKELLQSYTFLLERTSAKLDIPVSCIEQQHLKIWWTISGQTQKLCYES